MTVTLTKVDFIDTGAVRVDQIVANLELLRDAVNTQETDAALLERHVDRALGFGAVTLAVDAPGLHMALEAREHPDMSLAHVYITAGADSKDDTTIRILRNGKKLIAEPITILASEKRGKVVIGDVMKRQIVTRFESLDIESDSGRRVTVDMQFVNPRGGED